MVRLRLRRVGRKKQPSYRVVAAEKEAPRDGRFLEVVGFYNPRTEPSTITLKEDRIFDWLSKGAQPSDAVESLFRQMGTLERFERFKAGEDIEKLMQEYQVVEDTRNVSPQTRKDGPLKKSKKAKAAEAAAEAEKAEAEKAAAAKKEEKAKPAAEEKPEPEAEAPAPEETAPEAAAEPVEAEPAEEAVEEAAEAAEEAEQPAAEEEPVAEEAEAGEEDEAEAEDDAEDK